tara:strand:- start:276 stop:836 length:561 start_codon:yes stop_codon:yes gene_type:complete
MGSGISKQNIIICPEDICIDDFEKMKLLFKQIEKNKHYELENKELYQISDIHIKRKIKDLMNDIKILEFNNKKFILEKNLEYIENKNWNLKEKLINENILKFKRDKKKKKQEIEILLNMERDEKILLFKRRVSVNGSYDFGLFCDYMKMHTQEIHNIRIITQNGKLNELRLQVHSPNSQPKKKIEW